MPPYGAKQLAASFRTVRNNTIRVAEDIPEEQFGFVAAPGTRPVAMLLTHIALYPRMHYDMHGEKRLFTLAGYDFGSIIGRGAAEEQKPRSKAEVVDLLRTEGDKIGGWLGSLSDEFLAEIMTDPMGQNPRSRLEALLSIKEHEMHHRGQLMLIERQLGIVPHLTRAMAERMEQGRRQREAATATV